MSTMSKLTFGFLSEVLRVRLNCFGAKKSSNGRNFPICEESVHGFFSMLSGHFD